MNTTELYITIENMERKINSLTGNNKRLNSENKLLQEQLRICEVSNQRELLIGGIEAYINCMQDDSVENIVDWYLRVKDN